VARKLSSTAVQEELYPLPGESREREPFDDSRLVDLEADEESPFLRGQKRVSARHGSLQRRTWIRLKWLGMALVALAILTAIGANLYSYGKHSWRFRINSSDQIEVSGAQHVTHSQIMEVMGGDIGRNIFFVPLAQRKQQLEQISWIESASVMRFVPNRLRVEIHERTPVAFARIGSHVSLIDAGGTLMDLSPGGKYKYSFPVIAGMNAGEPHATRATRMKNYVELVRQLDSDGAHYSQELSEVDLTDTDDVKVVAGGSNGDVLVHLGSNNYLQRYKTYVTHAQQWRQQFSKLESVDLRYDGQIIVNPDLEGMPRQPALTPAAAKVAMAAGMKPAAIVNYEKYVTHPPLPASARPVKAHKAAARRALKKVAHRPQRVTRKSVASVATRNQPAPAHAAARPPAAAPPKPLAGEPSTPSPSRAPAVTPTGQRKPSAAIPKEAVPN
jgi:cell division protein FtsQ